MSQQDEQKADLDGLFAEGSLFATVDSTESAPNLESIWGNWLFRQSVVLEAGEPGITKTTLNYALATALVNRQPFLGVDGHYEAGRLRVLYLDMESSDSLIKSRKNMLGSPNNPDFLKCNLPNVTLKELEPYVDELVGTTGSLSVVFVDPLRMAFNLRSEDNNAIASAHMKYVRGLTQKWGCAIVLVHHSTKAEMAGTRKGSGAFAWAGLADIVWDFELLGKDYPPGLFKFYIPKSRLIQDDLCVCVRKVEGGFQAVDFPKGYDSGGLGTRVYNLQHAIDVLMRDGEERSDQEMMLAFGRAGFKTASPAFYGAFCKALTALMQLGVLGKTGYGKYRHTDSK